jgi:mono/diheme cytochrome c family protein
VFHAALTPVRHFYVDNLLGKLKETVAVAQSEKGGIYPPGSVVQLVPGEVMVKHPAGYNAATRDWEYFEQDVSREGSSIRKRGLADVVNRFGGNCFACHVKARATTPLP